MLSIFKGPPTTYILLSVAGRQYVATRTRLITVEARLVGGVKHMLVRVRWIFFVLLHCTAVIFLMFQFHPIPCVLIFARLASAASGGRNLIITCPDLLFSGRAVHRLFPATYGVGASYVYRNLNEPYNSMKSVLSPKPEWVRSFRG